MIVHHQNDPMMEFRCVSPFPIYVRLQGTLELGEFPTSEHSFYRNCMIAFEKELEEAIERVLCDGWDGQRDAFWMIFLFTKSGTTLVISKASTLLNLTFHHWTPTLIGLQCNNPKQMHLLMTNYLKSTNSVTHDSEKNLPNLINKTSAGRWDNHQLVIAALSNHKPLEAVPCSLAGF